MLRSQRLLTGTNCSSGGPWLTSFSGVIGNRNQVELGLLFDVPYSAPDPVGIAAARIQ